MSQTTDELLHATLALPAPDRKKIADALVASLPADSQPPANGTGVWTRHLSDLSIQSETGPL
jgi:hypothetical protein